MKKKEYIPPCISVCHLCPMKVLANSVHSVANPVDLQYCGGSDEEACVKQAGSYNVWDDDWSLTE